jgi:hypothetical protein
MDTRVQQPLCHIGYASVRPDVEQAQTQITKGSNDQGDCPGKETCSEIFHLGGLLDAGRLDGREYFS